MSKTKTKLADFSLKEQSEMEYSDLLKLRREAYAEHIDAMAIPPQIEQWSRKMEFLALNGSGYDAWCSANEIIGTEAEKAEWAKTCGIWYQRVPWVTALMIARYGEAIDHWPNEFSDEDAIRSELWRNGNLPAGVIQANKHGV